MIVAASLAAHSLALQECAVQDHVQHLAQDHAHKCAQNHAAQHHVQHLAKMVDATKIALV